MVKDTKYTSDVMNFIQKTIKEKPELIKTREKLYNTWWNTKEQEVNDKRDLEKNNLKPDSYTYFSYKN